MGIQAAAIAEGLSFSARAWLIGGGPCPPAVSDELLRRGLVEPVRSDLTPLGRALAEQLRGPKPRSSRAARVGPKEGPRRARATMAAPPRLEKAEQADAQRFFESIGGEVFVIGTRRPKGKRCPSCGTFVPEHQGTCQTPGISDLLVFLPRLRDRRRKVAVFVEMKAERGRPSEDQKAFLALCAAADIPTILGTFEVVVRWAVEQGYVREDGLAHYRRET